MIKVAYKPEYLGYLVIRTREGNPGQYFTKNGWVNKKINNPIEIDETMIWESDDLWDLVEQLNKLNVKPKPLSYSEGELLATKKHLEDMRSLVLKKKS